MNIASIVRLFFAVVTACFLTSCERQLPTAEPDPNVIAMDADDIAGIVRSAAGVEAGAWVIAETGDLGTRFARIVVTDDAGRYLLPDLPEASYQVWVRGYGLQDSSKVSASPGDRLDLEAIEAPDAATAAQIYPAAYWFAMLGLPDRGLPPFLALPGRRCASLRALRRDLLTTILASAYVVPLRIALLVRIAAPRGSIAKLDWLLPTDGLGAS